MGATKQAMLDEMEMDMEINVENFMRANGISVRRVGAPTLDYCVIDIMDDKVQGTLSVSLSLTRREAIALLRGCCVPVPNEMAG